MNAKDLMLYGDLLEYQSKSEAKEMAERAIADGWTFIGYKSYRYRGITFWSVCLEGPNPAGMLFMIHSDHQYNAIMELRDKA